MDRFRLDGRVAIVTGASSGLGVTFATALADAGADLVLAARRTDRLDAVRAEIEATGRRCLVVAADVAEQADCERVVDEAVAALGHVDVLVNNAGTSNAQPAHREDPAEFRRVIDVNLVGAYAMARAFGTACIAQERPGSIVNIASTLALAG